MTMLLSLQQHGHPPWQQANVLWMMPTPSRQCFYFCLCGLQPALHPASSLFTVHLRPGGSKPFKGLLLFNFNAFVLKSTAAKENNNIL